MQKGNGGGGRATPSLFKNKAGRKEPSPSVPWLPPLIMLSGLCIHIMLLTRMLLPFILEQLGTPRKGEGRHPRTRLSSKKVITYIVTEHRPIKPGETVLHTL